MGVYINPLGGEPKELWLDLNGRVVLGPNAKLMDGEVLVCLISNGGWTAAGVCYDEGERAAFSQPGDFRPRIWYAVPKRTLPAVSNVLKHDAARAALGL